MAKPGQPIYLPAKVMKIKKLFYFRILLSRLANGGLLTDRSRGRKLLSECTRGYRTAIKTFKKD